MSFGDTFIKAAVCGVALLGFASTANAANCPEGFPSAPLNFWVGYGAGGGTDLISRSLASEIENAQGWTISVANRPGAGSSVMMTQLAESEANGLTVGITSTGAITKGPNRNTKSPYSIGDFDFLGTGQMTPVSMTALADSPIDTYEDMVAFAKENGRLTVASSTNDASIFFDEISEREGIKIVIIPSKGTTESLQQLLGGHVDTALLGSGHVQHLESGRMVQLFTLGGQRPRWAADAPTSIELGYNFPGAVSFVLVAVPDGIEASIRTCLEEVLDEAVNSESFAAVQKASNQLPLNLGPDGASEMLESDFAFFKEFYAERRAAAN